MKTTNEFIGWCGLKYRVEIDKVDVGYRLHQKFWGKGFATEAAKRSIDYGFNDLHLNQIFAAAHAENLASIKVLEKIGMHFIGFNTIDGCPAKTFLITKF